MTPPCPSHNTTIITTHHSQCAPYTTHHTPYPMHNTHINYLYLCMTKALMGWACGSPSSQWKQVEQKSSAQTLQ
ncbi:hypothetical protein EON63_08910 [archaeon]|nr:MAG: hypothetical protein EON63_08910 [archaeon]